MLPTLRTTNPFDMLRDFDRVMRFSTPDDTQFTTASYPVDINEDDNSLTVEAELPGFKREEIEVNIEQGVLSINAQREAKEQKGEPHLKERSFARVSRRFSLPTSVDSEKVEANLKDGVLTLTIPKREEVKARKIEVK